MSTTTRREITDDDLLHIDLFAGDMDDGGARARSNRMVTTRTLHTCRFTPETHHEIPIGSRARVERAILDGEWYAIYTCVPCLTAWLREME